MGLLEIEKKRIESRDHKFYKPIESQTMVESTKVCQVNVETVKVKWS